MEEKLIQMGQRLRNARLKRDDTQKEFAARIGVSIPTLAKMEKGLPSIPIGTWAKALNILGRLDDLDQILVQKESLFDAYEKQVFVKKERQRAGRRRRK